MYRMMALTIIYLLLSGCSNHENTYKKNRETVDTVSIETDKEKERILFNEFKKAFPDAQIVCSVINKEGDMILLYSSSEKKEEVNFAVVTTHSFNAILLGDNETQLQFANGADSLELLDSKRFVIKAVDLKNGKHIDFLITTDYDQKTNMSDFKIVSKEAP